MGGGNGAGGFSALRRMELEQTNAGCGGRRISAPAAATGKKTRQDDDNEIEPAITQQTDL